MPMLASKSAAKKKSGIGFPEWHEVACNVRLQIPLSIYSPALAIPEADLKQERTLPHIYSLVKQGGLDV